MRIYFDHLSYSVQPILKKGHLYQISTFHAEIIQKMWGNKLLQMWAFLIRSVACLKFGEEENNVPLNLCGPIGRPVDCHTSKDVDTEKDLTNRTKM